MANQIQTVGDMMSAIQDEIEKAKSGELKPAVASIVFRGRALQLKTVQVSLQFQRMQRDSEKKNKKVPQDFNLLNGKAVKETSPAGST